MKSRVIALFFALCVVLNPSSGIAPVLIAQDDDTPPTTPEITQLSEAILTAPFDADLYRQRGDAYFAIGQYPQAEDDYTAYIRLEAADPLGYALRARARGLNGAMSDAQGDINTALGIDGEFAPAHVSQGVLLTVTGEYNEAIASYTTAVVYDPALAEAYRLRGYAMMDINAYQSAIDDITRAIDLTPQPALVYIRRAEAHNALNDHDRAIDDLTTALSLSPENPIIYDLRGESHYQNRAFDLALADFALALSNEHPIPAIVLVHQGETLVATGDLDSALMDFDQAIALTPTYVPAYLARGDLYITLAELELAAQDFDTAIRLDPENADAYFNRGLVYDALGNLPIALESYERYIELAEFPLESIAIRIFELRDLIDDG